MSTLRKLMLVGSMVIATALCREPRSGEQQSQQQMPMMGHGTMMGGQQGR